MSNMQYYTDGKRHLICVPYSIANLHKMARDLGIARCWFHKNHYDIPKRRLSVVESLCIKISTRELVEIIHGSEVRNSGS